MVDLETAFLTTPMIGEDKEKDNYNFWAYIQNGKEKKPNVNVLREGNVQKSLLKTIRKRRNF